MSVDFLAEISPHALPLMRELFRTLPAPGDDMSIDERVAWLTACAALIDMLYGQSSPPLFVRREGHRIRIMQ